MSTENARHIKLVLLDVDGVLTDGSITYIGEKTESKSFNIKDGLGIKLLQDGGIRVGIITGRVSPMVKRRAEELGIDPIIQGREDKGTALKEVAKSLNLEAKQIAYMGDDLPDLSALNIAGFAMAPADAHTDVLSVADWTASKGGGMGAVREACDFILMATGFYGKVTDKFEAGN